ncbi:MAG TPA: hypothetical protein DHW71_09190 [Gammaproteobacteria bacterium]|nr:hypothetical protein [Gammaproteobacteria bacterium]HCK93149.1 hypothetical protein [Gammaproteobacteria bacterium]
MTAQNQLKSSQRPLLWAGPLLRRTEADRLIFWLCTSEELDMELVLGAQNKRWTFSAAQLKRSREMLKLGDHCYVYLFDLKPGIELPLNQKISYDFLVDVNSLKVGLADLCPKIGYNHARPFFQIHNRVKKIAHGSCRKPHSPAGDGLVALDRLIENHVNAADIPDVLIMSGDQVYVDDVAGPMLDAIHQFIPLLGLRDEPLPSDQIQTAADLHGEHEYYYKRETLLPATENRAKVLKTFFKGIKKPIFTTTHGGNHLMSMAEIIAMYLLCWSPIPWRFIQLSKDEFHGKVKCKDKKRKAQADAEFDALVAFSQGLPHVQRLLAHVPSAMIFDDHDITDDWNLSIAWEKAAYENPFAKRIIGNALLGYFIFQGWGNSPEHFNGEFKFRVQSSLNKPGTDIHQETIDELLGFRDWDYSWPTSPGLLVLDTRTNRWRSERNEKLPSGLMDWESITDLQQQLKGREAVILVTPAPVFGVKLIEAIQRIFTALGQPLMVDAENWMAHGGSAYALMNLFYHSKTPTCFSLLSGDVHYSFVYKVKLRGQDNGPDIWQFTSSGLKNEFPAKLLDFFDRLNRWLYSPYSPLNWFTKRKDMKVTPLKPSSADHGERLLNKAGVGLLSLNEEGKPVRFQHLGHDGSLTSFDEE